MRATDLDYFGLAERLLAMLEDRGTEQYGGAYPVAERDRFMWCRDIAKFLEGDFKLQDALQGLVLDSERTRLEAEESNRALHTQLHQAFVMATATILGDAPNPV